MGQQRNEELAPCFWFVSTLFLCAHYSSTLFLLGVAEKKIQGPEEVEEDCSGGGECQETSRNRKENNSQKMAVEEIAELASSLSISSSTKSSWYSPNYQQFPYTIYMFKNENTPAVSTKFVCTIKVMPCGTKLKVVIGVPRLFFEHLFIQRRLGDDNHAQHSLVLRTSRWA
jgi:hypothetical protein